MGGVYKFDKNKLCRMRQGCITFELLMYIFDVAKLKNKGIAWEGMQTVVASEGAHF